MPNRAALQAQVAAEVKGRILPHGPVVTCHDPDYDETVIDFSDPEFITTTQTDEHGVTHTVIVSAKMISQLQPHILKWLTSNCN